MKMMLGLAAPTEGEVELLGRTMDRATRIETLREVGSLIEVPGCYAHLTARENLDIVRRLKGLPASSIDEALETVGLDGVGRKRAGQFSLGMKQRLGLAAALLGRPRLVLLDEPTNGLDPAGIHEMRELIRSLPRTRGVTVLVSSHLLSEIDQMSDHVGIIAQGPIGDLRAQAKRTIALRTTDDDRAIQVVPGLSYDGDWLVSTRADDAWCARASLALAQAGIGVIRMEEHADALEDIFLRLTGSEA